jgi:hypothetical protein
MYFIVGQSKMIIQLVQYIILNYSERLFFAGLHAANM